MTDTARRLFAAFLACALAALAACSSSKAPARSCATAADCPADARCISTTCVENAPPSVVVALPSGPQTSVLLSFDASATVDPDADDSVASFTWTFRALSGQTCELPVVAGTGPVANVRFGCAGRYAVDVTATDQMGATATATEELDVVPQDAALLVVGADVQVDHFCATPTSCTAGPALLSASTPGIEQVSFSWTVEPPADRPLSASRRVSFSPSAAVAAPEVTVDTDGTAISGDWVFRVEARDTAGVIGTAAVRVSIGNNPPMVTKTILVPNHAFDGSRFTAAGEIPYSVSDPDGDPLVGPIVAVHHAGDGASVFDASFAAGPARVTYSVEVPYTSPADVAYLIGGVGLERTIVFSVSDVNGASTTESWPIVVGNRPPALGPVPAPFAIDHTYDAAALAYVADVPLSQWTDPDGDPLWQVPGTTTGDATCADLTVVNGVARAHCRRAFTGTPNLQGFAATHTVVQAIQDPWAQADRTSSVTFTILNRPPSITSTATFNPRHCARSGTCCAYDPEAGVCDYYRSTLSGIINVPSRWADPDGDPISVNALAVGEFTPVQPLVCTPAECVLQISVAPITFCTTTALTQLPTSVSDGVQSESAALPIQADCTI